VTNPAPTAANDTLSAGPDDARSIVGNALANDSDPDGDALSATVQSSVAGSNGGLFSIAANGAVAFDPNGDFDDLAAGATRNTTLTYAISDGQGGTDTATITVTVTGEEVETSTPTPVVADIEPALFFEQPTEADTAKKLEELRNDVSAYGIVVQTVNGLERLGYDSGDISADGIVIKTVNWLDLLSPYSDDLALDGIVVETVESIKSMNEPVIQVTGEKVRLFSNFSFNSTNYHFQ
jgi:hypothetical protein